MTNQTDQTPEVIELSPENASTNFYWLLGQHEVFNLQTTIRGIVTPAQIEAHLTSITNTLKAIVNHKGRAKAIGQQEHKTVTSGGTIETSPAPVHSPAPAAKQATQAAIKEGEGGSAQTKTMKVETMHKSLTENGKPYIKVKGAPFTQFGVKAWPEAVAEFMDVDAMEIGTEYLPPETMRNAIVELNEKGNPRKILRFTN